MSETARQWTDDEPGLLRLRRELSRLKKRAMARPLRTIAVALALAGLVVADRARKPPLHSALIVLSVKEGRMQTAKSPMAKGELRAYIRDVSFNKRHLLEIIERHGLYPGLHAIDPYMAVEFMWYDLDVEVFQNYFLEERWDGSLRSARIAITYSSPDPALALAVVRDLGRLIVEFEEDKRRQAVEIAAEELGGSLREVEARLDERAAELARAEIEYERISEEERGALEVRLARLRQELFDESTRAEQIGRALSSLRLRAAAEGERQGLVFRVVDEKRPDEHRRGALDLAALGALVFILALPLAVVAVGAFDPRVYDGGDVARLGVPVVGEVPAFEGARIGSLAERRRQARDGRPSQDRIH